MRGQRYWVLQGILEPMLGANVPNPEDDELRLGNGGVRLTTGELGTEVKWHVNSPCVTSLFKAMQWLPSARPPYILRFHAVGWFEEVYRDPRAAVTRMEQVLARGDRHFTSRVFIKEATPDNATLPRRSETALSGQTVSDDYAVDCSFDENSHLFKVERVGPKSAIGRVWGTYTSSHPCQSGGSYGDPVNATYEEVLRSGKPRYDHVLAALRLPDNALHWVPYHRAVFPKRNDRGDAGVSRDFTNREG